jgi:hypothetical protein
MSEPSVVRPRGRLLPLVLGLVAGLVIGGGVASAVFLYLLFDQQARYEVALAQAGAKPVQDALNLVGMNPLIPKGDNLNAKKPASEESQVLEAGKAYIDDFEKHRLLKVYRATTPEFQKKNEQAKFIEEHDKLTYLRHLDSTSYTREERVRKLPKKKGYEFYFSGREAGFGSQGPRINVAMILVDVDGEWLIDDLVVTTTHKR